MSDYNRLPPIGGIDLGATKILSVVVSETGSLLSEDVRPTMSDEGHEAVIGHMAASLRKALAKAGIAEDKLGGIGVCAPGPIDHAHGIVTRPPNLPGWHDVPLASRIAEAFGVPCVLENDANCAAIAEHRWGAGRGSQHMLFLTLSSGVGGGIIVNGALYRGASGLAGEVGHITVNTHGPSCGCGRRGCLEAYASGLAITRQGLRLVAKHPDSPLARLVKEDPPLSAILIHEAADKGDEGARELVREAGYNLGIGLASLVNIFNPQVVVLGGGLTKMGDLYLGPMREAIQNECFPQAWRDLRIAVGELGDKAPALGAAAIALETHLQARE